MSTTGNMYDGNFIGEVGRAAATALAAAAPAAYPSGDIYDRQLISKLGQSFAKAIDDAGGLGGGGGGGSSMLRNTVTVLGYTSAATAAVQAFAVTPGFNYISAGYWTIGDWTGNYIDVPAPTGWTADKSLSSAQGGGDHITFTRTTAGSGVPQLGAPDLSGLTYYDSGSVTTVAWNGLVESSSFTDGTYAGGAAIAPHLFDLAEGLVTRPISLGWASSAGLANDVEIGFLDGDGSTFTALALITAPGGGTSGLLTPPQASVSDWINGRDAALVARIVGDTPVGGDVLVWAVVDQVAV